MFNKLTPLLNSPRKDGGKVRVYNSNKATKQYLCVCTRMCTPLNEQSHFLMFLLTQTRTQ